MAKVSRWDRPRLPRDLRWFIRLVGKVMICTGVLLFGFVGYQLWGTGIEYSRAQSRLDDQFDRLLAEVGVDRPDPPVLSDPESADTAPQSNGPQSDRPQSDRPQSTEPALASDELPVRDFGYVAEYPVGQLWIPSIGLDGMNIVAGVGRDDLKEGPGHFPGTPFPGELGNAAIAGHRTTYGAPFDHLPDVEIGDELAVLTAYGTYTYRMTGFEIVNPEDGQVVATTDTSRATLTLVTCTPRGTAQQRYILHAELIPELSDEPGQFVDRSPGDLGANGALPGDDLPDEPTGTTIPAAATTQPAAATTTVPFEEVPLDGDSVDTSGFNSHWFDDADAWPHIAGWGLASAGFVIAPYRLARRLRNGWVGLAVGIAPFVVTLYFFYQNANRLLPAAL